MAKKTTCDVCGKERPLMVVKEHEGASVRVCGTCEKKGWRKAHAAALRAKPFESQGERPRAPIGEGSPKLDRTLERAEAASEPAEPAPAVETPAPAAPAEPKKVTARRTRKPRPERKPRGPSVSSTVKELCEAGKTNEDIWPVIKERFSLPDEHKWYVAWYRRHHIRKAEKAAASTKETP
jgi:hypothetical protein